jgi:hypothetical protein
VKLGNGRTTQLSGSFSAKIFLHSEEMAVVVGTWWMKLETQNRTCQHSLNEKPKAQQRKSF